MIDPTVLAILTLLLYFWLRRKRNNLLPPGPMRLPVLGSVIQLQLADSVYPHLALSKLAEKYGDVMSFGFGMHTAVIVSSFEAMQDVFKCIETNSYRFEFPYVSDRNYGKNLGIIWCHGQNWIDVKRFTKKILKEFGYGKVKIMDESLNDSAKQLVESIKMDLLDSPDGTFFVDMKKFSVHVLNVVWNLAGGYKFDPNDENLKRNMECVDKVDQIFGHSNLYNMFPFLKTWFPKQMRYEEHLNIHHEIHEFTESLIDDAKEKRSQRLDTEPISFIEAFLDKIEENRGDADTIFTDEQLIIIVEDLFFGGLVTTGTLLTWSILFLVLNPDVQATLRREILGKMKNPTDSMQAMELKKIPYLKATVLEILRMANIVPIPLPRCPTQDVKMKEYIIPKGSVLFYNLHVMYNDKVYWNDPENFRPERFLNETGEIDKLRSERILNTVFGVGPRVCFGETLALDSLFMFLAAMIINFKFDAIHGRELSVQNPHPGLALGPHSYCVKITNPAM
ncbi:hypothetical protein HA402_004050 [Bradysia odoriphaga]|nr:hypothetical protein HA402_004050 [Bradysia odoriphaga]